MDQNEKKDIVEQSVTDFDDVLEDISDQYKGNCTLNDLEEMIKEMLATLPKLNRSEIRREMEQMQVRTYESPTTFDINKGLAQAQGYKDRLTEIYTLAAREYKLRKRCLEMLFDAVNLISKASSADKRRGEATMKYPIYLLQLEAADIFLKEVEGIQVNLKNVGDVISRQGSVISSQISLGEYVSRKHIDSSKSKSEAEGDNFDYQSGIEIWDAVK